MPLYRVDVEEINIWSIYVDAVEAQVAEAEALELAANLDPDDVDSSSYVYVTNLRLDDDDDVWVGGENGEFISYAEYKGRQG